jgi:hypothetical protein
MKSRPVVPFAMDHAKHSGNNENACLVCLEKSADLDLLARQNASVLSAKKTGGDGT